MIDRWSSLAAIATWMAVAHMPEDARFIGLIDQLPLMVWAHDAAGTQEFVNKTFCEYFGVTPQQMGEQPWEWLTHPEDGPAYRDEFMAAVKERSPFHNEVRVRRSDGEWRWLESWGTPRVDHDGNYQGHIGTSADVTDRKTADRALAESAAFTDRVLDGLFTFAGVLDVEGVVISANRAPLDAAGIQLIDVVGKHFWDCYWWSHDEALGERLRSGCGHAAEGHVVRWDAEVRVVDDGRLMIDFQIAPLIGPNGRVTHLVVSGLDLTERMERQASEQAARQRAELIASTLSAIEAVSSVNEQVEVLTEVLVPRFADYVTIEDPASEQPVLALSHVDPDRAITLASLRRWHRLENTDGASVSAVARGEARLVTHVDADATTPYGLDAETTALLEQLETHSYLAVPIGLGGNRRGAMLCGLTDPERRGYDRDDLHLMTELAGRVSGVITATRAREKERESSLRLQRALLPDQLLPHPTIDVAARYQAAGRQLEVGGDWYDTFVWPDGEYGVIVGDVVGHGIEAAAAMGRLRAAAGILFASGPPDPAAMLATLDRLAHGPDGADYLTAFCVVIDPNRNELRYASAGHPPAFIVAGSGEVRWLDQAVSPPISELSVPVRHSVTVQIDADDTMVVYSDGLVERRDGDLVADIEQLAEQAKGLVGLDIEHINQHLVASVADPAEDDIVVVSLRYASTGNLLRETIHARHADVSAIRARLDSWLDGLGIGSDTRQRVLLGTSEACANAIEHGYEKIRSGRIGVRASENNGTVQVIVSDSGIWHERRTQLPHRGRGTHIMRSVADSFERFTSATGTAVTMTFDA